MVKDNDPNIYIDKMLSKEEIDAREASGQKNVSKYERVVADSITGLNFLYEYNGSGWLKKLILRGFSK